MPVIGHTALRGIVGMALMASLVLALKHADICLAVLTHLKLATTTVALPLPTIPLALSDGPLHTTSQPPLGSRLPLLG